MVPRDPVDSRPHPQGGGVSPLTSHGWQQCDTHHPDGVWLCSVSMHLPGLDTGYGFWSLDYAAMAVV